MKKRKKQPAKFKNVARQSEIKIPDKTVSFDDLMRNIIKVNPRMK